MNRRATDLLLATLLDGDRARDAWQRWTRAVRSPFRALADDAVMARPLLPLIYDSVRRNALPVDGQTATLLRSAYLTESLRSKAYREIVNELTTSLAGIDFLLIKGAAVGELYYAEPALRHAHDVEIVARDAAAVHRALGGRLVHPSGLALRVHDLPLWEHTMTMPNGVRTVDATAALMLALTHASRTQRWACDAVMIIRNAEIDWSRIPRFRFFRKLRWLAPLLPPKRV